MQSSVELPQALVGKVRAHADGGHGEDTRFQGSVVASEGGRMPRFEKEKKASGDRRAAEEALGALSSDVVDVCALFLAFNELHDLVSILVQTTFHRRI